MTGVSRDNTAGEDGDYRVVGNLDYFDEHDEAKFRGILKDIMLLKADMNGVEFEPEEIGEESELPDAFKDPFDELFDDDDLLGRNSRPVDYLVLCELMGEEPCENPQTCAVCGAHALDQCPWAWNENTEEF
ncbi:MAG: hypothetical protein ACP5SH_27210 [Syntrophobacteraceae bacterium]